MGYTGLMVLSIVLLYWESFRNGTLIEDGDRLGSVIEQVHKIHSNWDYENFDYTSTSEDSPSNESNMEPMHNIGPTGCYMLG